MSIFPAKVLFATDGSRDAELAATTAVGLANATGSELHLIHVGAEVTHGAFPTVQVGVLPRVHQDELDSELDRQAKGLLEAEVGWMESSEIEVAGSHLRRGRADEEECGTSQRTVGSRGDAGRPKVADSYGLWADRDRSAARRFRVSW
jgi:nucleotide-binding universal stress UspA family protein